MIVALPGHCSITHAGGGIALRLQVMSQPRLISCLLVSQWIRRPQLSRLQIKRNPFWRQCLTAIRNLAPR